jgi:hypothetical protein
MKRNRRCWRAMPLLVVVVLVCVPGSAHAQATMDDLQRELASLRREMQELRAEIDSLKAGAADAPGRDRRGDDAQQGPVLPPPVHAEPDQPAPAAQVPVDVLTEQIAELARVKVESGSKMPVRLLGTLHASAFVNSGEANWLDNPNIVAPRPESGRTGSFSMGLRQTRLGLAVDGPTLGPMRTSGQVVADFFGGIPGFQTGQTIPLPRLLVAFARLETERTAIEIGQDHVVLAPRDPTSLAAFAFPALFRSGNLYLRAPQIRVEQAIGSRVRATGALIAPIGGDLTGENYRFVPPALAGERTRRPAFEARLAVDSTTDVDAVRRAGVGVSGHYGSERRPTGTATAWAAAVDFGARRDWIGVAGEIFSGRNVDAFGGATGLDARAAGGWTELQLFASPRLAFHGGIGIDDLRDLPAPTVPRRRNRSAYGNVIVSFSPEVQGSFEYRWLGTLPGSGGERHNHHFDWVLTYKF